MSFEARGALPLTCGFHCRKEGDYAIFSGVDAMDRPTAENTPECIKYGEGNTSIIITAPHGGKLKFPGAKIRAGPGSCSS